MHLCCNHCALRVFQTLAGGFVVFAETLLNARCGCNYSEGILWFYLNPFHLFRRDLRPRTTLSAWFARCGCAVRANRFRPLFLACHIGRACTAQLFGLPLRLRARVGRLNARHCLVRSCANASAGHACRSFPCFGQTTNLAGICCPFNASRNFVANLGVLPLRLPTMLHLLCERIPFCRCSRVCATTQESIPSAILGAILHIPFFFCGAAAVR